MGTLKVFGGGNITTVGSGDTITINATNTTAVKFKTTNFTSSGVWTKDLTTTFVTIFGWCGGGGASGAGYLGIYGGWAGSQGTMFYAELWPESFFGATEVITIGVGGLGGSHSASGNDGGITSIGSVIVPAAQNNKGVINGSFAIQAVMPIMFDQGLFYYEGGNPPASNLAGSAPSTVFRTITEVRNASFSPTGGGSGASGSGHTGASSGSMRLPDGTIIVPGATGGIGASQDGQNGHDGIIYGNFMTGGTGGGGGGSNNGRGGNGGFPGAGGGGAGNGAGMPYTKGGNGGDGYVIIWEYH